MSNFVLLPPFLEIYRDQAVELFEKQLIKYIEFSGSTYQVQVIEKKKENWAFLQLDSKGQLKDCFCSCDQSDEEFACVHLAAAFLKIYGPHNLPLHQRFERSLWNKLFYLYANAIGYDIDLIKQVGKQQFKCQPVVEKEVIFLLTAKNASTLKELKDLIFQRKIPTEETSLKFSNLSQEEILHWREGNSSLYLSYELSFWSDLAKWIFQLTEENNKGVIEFKHSAKNIPNYLQINFEELEGCFYLSEEHLSNIIPALATVNSPLKIHHAPQETIQRLTYDQQQKKIWIEHKQKAAHEKLVKREGIALKGWVYIPNEGFYIKDQDILLSQETIHEDLIDHFLTEYREIVKELLEGTVLHSHPVEPQYTITFDLAWNLHISCYIFKAGDLDAGDSHWFGNWIYLDNQGFYQLDNQRFNSIETQISVEDVPEFINQQRVWLNNYDGFQTHLASIEAQMTYQMSREGYLTFFRKIPTDDEEIRTKEFGSWIYILGQGFFSKTINPIGLPVRPGIALNRDQIPLFIRSNGDELQLIQGFFSLVCPVISAGLDIALDKEEHITVLPIYELSTAYQKKQVQFLDDFVYVEGEGFHELPVEYRLPDRFKHSMEINKSKLHQFLTHELGMLSSYIVNIDSRLVKADSIQLQIIEIQRCAQSGNYLIKFNYRTHKGEVPVITLWQKIRRKKQFAFEEAGLFYLEEKRFNWLRLLSKNQVDESQQTIELSTMELIRLQAFEEVSLAKDKSIDYVNAQQLLEELTQFRIPEEPDLTGLNSILRPYQILGVRWLWFLYQHQLSGLLCDDMGLGKTHQTMALIVAIINHLKKDKEKPSPHFLVVCPTSVIYHWQEKLQHFLPELRICTFHGSKRSLTDFQGHYDLLLTSYGIWRIENTLLAEVKFELAIFDEIQIAKNFASRIYTSLLQADAKMRLGLTGTPLENHLRELKSLFDIVLPKYMPSEADYREFFIKPIEKEGSKERQQVLSKLIKPFVMRRKKKDVLFDLPEKTEEISHCELLPAQESLYIEVLTRSRQKIIEELKEDQASIPYMHIFALLSSLKQICNHPAAYLKVTEKYKEYQSGKWELFLELLYEARESQQKVVIFSQYLNMLDIIENYLTEANIGFAAIRGSTTDRQQQLQRFNGDPTCEVFVASLQAAGLGIDLTAASVVIHYDRWWNAARENQATDRVHRIGQKRGVQVFKLVTKETFEEKIDALITKKGNLMEETVGVDDHGIVKQFSRADILELLNYTQRSSTVWSDLANENSENENSENENSENENSENENSENENSETQNDKDQIKDH